MNMSDDVSGAVVGMSSQVAQKGVETAQHVVDKAIDAIARLLEILRSREDFKLRKDGDVKSSDMTDIKSGKVEIKELIENAKKTDDTLISTPGQTKNDVKFIEKKCKEYGIPFAVTNKKGEDCHTVHVRGSDKDIFAQICTEKVQDNIAIRSDKLGNIVVNKWEMEGLQNELLKHDLPASFAQTKDGEYFCLFEKEHEKAVKMARNEYIRKHGEVKNDFTVTRNQDVDGFCTLKDEKSGKEISFDELQSRTELSEMLQNEFGYDENKANIACDKYAEGLPENVRGRFISNDPHLEFSDIQNHVELKGENILVKDYNCLRVTPESTGVPCIVFCDENNKFAVLNPESMSKSEMVAEIKNSLGVSDENTIAALVDKAEKVNDYYVKQNDKNFTHTTTNIERLDKSTFEVSESNRDLKLTLSFSDKKKAISELTEMYKSQGLSERDSKQMAKEVFAKAKAQSAEKVLQIEEIKVAKQGAESHGTPKSDAMESVITVKYGGKSKEFKFDGDRDKVETEIAKEFDVSKKEAEKLLDKAVGKISEDNKNTLMYDSINDKHMLDIDGDGTLQTERTLEANRNKPKLPEAPKVEAPKVEAPEIEAPKRRK